MTEPIYNRLILFRDRVNQGIVLKNLPEKERKDIAFFASTIGFDMLNLYKNSYARFEQELIRRAKILTKFYRQLYEKNLAKHIVSPGGLLEIVDDQVAEKHRVRYQDVPSNSILASYGTPNLVQDCIHDSHILHISD